MDLLPIRPATGIKHVRRSKTHSVVPHVNRLLRSSSRSPLLICALTVHETHHTPSALFFSLPPFDITVSSRHIWVKGLSSCSRGCSKTCPRRWHMRLWTTTLLNEPEAEATHVVTTDGNSPQRVESGCDTCGDYIWQLSSTR